LGILRDWGSCQSPPSNPSIWTQLALVFHLDELDRTGPVFVVVAMKYQTTWWYFVDLIVDNEEFRSLKEQNGVTSSGCSRNASFWQELPQEAMKARYLIRSTQQTSHQSDVFWVFRSFLWIIFLMSRRR
jgi:hypothetical protein